MREKKIQYSILDIVLKRDSDNNRETYLRLIKAVKYAEKYGYTRFWIAEHHNYEFLLSSAPSILLCHLANKTKKIKIGSGGIMLQNHTTIFIAEQFGTLSALFPGRIDLGVGRGPGGDENFISLIKDCLRQLLLLVSKPSKPLLR